MAIGYTASGERGAAYVSGNRSAPEPRSGNALGVAATTASAVGGVMGYYGARAESQAQQLAAGLNAAEATRNAEAVRQRAAEDERQFRLAFRMDEAQNRARIGASGVALEGSPLEVLRDNVARAEHDALNIFKAGEYERESFLRQAAGYRLQAGAAGRAGKIAGAAALLGGIASTISTGRQAGAF